MSQHSPVYSNGFIGKISRGVGYEDGVQTARDDEIPISYDTIA